MSTARLSVTANTVVYLVSKDKGVRLKKGDLIKKEVRKLEGELNKARGGKITLDEYKAKVDEIITLRHQWYRLPEDEI